MKIIKETHVDHGLSREQIDYLVELFSGRDSFFIETVNMPEELGTVPCGLYGPLMGDDPVSDSDDGVYFATRGERPGESKLIKAPTRQVKQVSVIAGPHGDDSCVLYTAFGGPVAPRETFDPSIQENEEALSESRKFWAQHALADEEL